MWCNRPIGVVTSPQEPRRGAMIARTGRSKYLELAGRPLSSGLPHLTFERRAARARARARAREERGDEEARKHDEFGRPPLHVHAQQPQHVNHQWRDEEHGRVLRREIVVWRCEYFHEEEA